MIFYKSIILIVDQTDEGITGFILNRPSDLFMIKEVESSEKIKIDLYYGGPVSSEHFYLLRSEKIYTEIINVYDDLFWGNNLDFLINQVEKGIIKMDDFILFQGYSGWDLGQLDDEIANNSWIITNKKAEEILITEKKIVGII